MLPGLPRGVAPASFAILLVGLTGCATSPETRFYVLTPLPAAERPADALPHSSPVIGLRPVSLPEHLDRPQIVTRVADNRLQLSEFDQWGSPLRDNFTRVLARNLSILVPADHVTVFPYLTSSRVDYEVTVEVNQFEGTLGAGCSLAAHWTIWGSGGRASVAMGTSSHTEPAGDSYPTLVTAESRLVAALGRDIAKALQAVPR